MQVEPAGQGFLESALCKKIPVGLPLRVLPYIIYNGSGNTLVGVIKVTFYSPEAFGYFAIESGFDPSGEYVTVLAHGGSVVHHLVGVGIHPFVAVLVFSGRVDNLCVERSTHPVTELVFVEDGRVDQIE